MDTLVTAEPPGSLEIQVPWVWDGAWESGSPSELSYPNCLDSLGAAEGNTKQRVTSKGI